MRRRSFLNRLLGPALAPILGQKIEVEPEINEDRLKMLRDLEEAERVAARIDACLTPKEAEIVFRIYGDCLPYEEIIRQIDRNQGIVK